MVYSGSPEHKSLMQEGKKYLKSIGFKDSEIKLEEEVIDPKIQGGKGRYIVDVVGKSKNRLVMVECGSCNKTRAKYLRKIGTLKLIPYKSLTRTITVHDYHADFIDRQSRQFNLSKFVRISLDAYIDYVRRLRDNGEKNV